MDIKKIIFAVCGCVLLTGCAVNKSKINSKQVSRGSVGTSFSDSAVLTPDMMNTAMHEAEIDRVLFHYDSCVISDEAKAILDRQVEVINKGGDSTIVIEGHTDERGTRDYNIGLGERRAEAVKKYLVSKGVSSERLAVISYGKERPALEGHDEEAWKYNRRAVIVAEGDLRD